MRRMEGNGEEKVQMTREERRQELLRAKVEEATSFAAAEKVRMMAERDKYAMLVGRKELAARYHKYLNKQIKERRVLYVMLNVDDGSNAGGTDAGGGMGPEHGGPRKIRVKIKSGQSADFLAANLLTKYELDPVHQKTITETLANAIAKHEADNAKYEAEAQKVGLLVAPGVGDNSDDDDEDEQGGGLGNTFDAGHSSRSGQGNGDDEDGGEEGAAAAEYLIMKKRLVKARRLQKEFEAKRLAATADLEAHLEKARTEFGGGEPGEELVRELLFERDRCGSIRHQLQEARDRAGMAQRERSELEAYKRELLRKIEDASKARAGNDDDVADFWASNNEKKDEGSGDKSDEYGGGGGGSDNSDGDDDDDDDDDGVNEEDRMLSEEEMRRQAAEDTEKPLPPPPSPPPPQATTSATRSGSLEGNRDGDFDNSNGAADGEAGGKSFEKKATAVSSLLGRLGTEVASGGAGGAGENESGGGLSARSAAEAGEKGFVAVGNFLRRGSKLWSGEESTGDGGGGGERPGQQLAPEGEGEGGDKDTKRKKWPTLPGASSSYVDTASNTSSAAHSRRHDADHGSNSGNEDEKAKQQHPRPSLLMALPEAAGELGDALVGEALGLFGLSLVPGGAAAAEGVGRESARGVLGFSPYSIDEEEKDAWKKLAVFGHPELDEDEEEVGLPTPQQLAGFLGPLGLVAPLDSASYHSSGGHDTDPAPSTPFIAKLREATEGR